MHNNKLSIFLSLVVTLGVSGCATTPAVTSPNDPWEGWNRDVQSFNDTLDEYAMEPAAKGYRWIMPSFADTAVSNFFSNIEDISVFINSFLQGKFEQSGSDTARFLVNSTAGIGGLIDVATMIDLPKHDEDFGQTLGVWGVPTGPYMVLPFFGPSSPRGVIGLIGDAAMNPISYIDEYIALGLFGLNALDTRADNLGLEKVASEAALDRYSFFRDAYISRRRYQVLDGNVPEDDPFEYDENLDEESLSPISPY